MGCKCGDTCFCGICTCNVCDSCGCFSMVSDECCLNGSYYVLVEGTFNNYVEFSFGYVLGTDTSSDSDIAAGVMAWYYGDSADTSVMYNYLPSGGCIVASGSASNCSCSALNFGYADCPFYDPCDGGKYPENPNPVQFDAPCP
jgi:hypothetical protein